MYQLNTHVGRVLWQAFCIREISPPNIDNGNNADDIDDGGDDPC